ncbi:MAG: DUF922 domain-containing protein [Pseudomonadota bacterium]
MLRVFFVVFLSIAFLPEPAAAKIVEKTETKHYRIGGKTPLGLVRGMHKKGRKRGTKVALATIRTKADFDLDFPNPRSCRNGTLNIDVAFTIRLPQPRFDDRLPGETAKKFNIFYDFLKRHEEEHKRIHLQCLARLQSQANRLLSRVRSCDQIAGVTEQFRAITQAETAKCRAAHNALDRRDEPRVGRSALYKAATVEARSGGGTAPRPLLSSIFSSEAMTLNQRQ